MQCTNTITCVSYFLPITTDSNESYSVFYSLVFIYLYILYTININNPTNIRFKIKKNKFITNLLT